MPCFGSRFVVVFCLSIGGHLWIDIIVPWNQIEQIIATTTSEQYSCPICLSSDLVAPQITQCGHVFCHSCILHYLALGEQEWRKCPICHERLHSSDLLSVYFHHVHNYSKFKDGSRKSAEDLVSTRDYVVLKLMQRSSVRLGCIIVFFLMTLGICHNYASG
jgi:hypothetical protein